MMTDAHLKTPSGKLRARALGVPFRGDVGPLNAITDVPGLEVGYHTLISGDGPLRVGHGPVRTGVTAILPRGKSGVGLACAAGLHSFNGNGELTGAHWINEAGNFGTPIMITNTHAVGPVHRGVIDWMFRQKPEHLAEWQLPVVGETWDGYLNDVYGNHITSEMAGLALDAAKSGAIEEGSIGGGTGMNCYAFKGGNGTASRLVEFAGETYAVGVFLQCNFGARHELMVAGHALGQQLLADNPIADHYMPAKEGAGSCIGILATNAPMLPGQLQALARRMPLGLARTGTTGSHFSGDIFLAFSTVNSGAFDSGYHLRRGEKPSLASAQFVPWSQIDDFYAAAAHATEEAVLNALIANETMTGRDGHRSPHLPHEAVRKLFKA
jgi:D-aminopeptidase